MRDMKFVRKKENTERYVDNIFSVVNAAKADPNGINATAGCLYDEEGKLFTFKCVFEEEAKIPAARRAAYASSPAGNSDYIELVSDFVLDGRVSNHHKAIATPGGTGAIATAVSSCLDEGDHIIYPKIAWATTKSSPVNTTSLFRPMMSMTSMICLKRSMPCQARSSWSSIRHVKTRLARLIPWMNGKRSSLSSIP